jgi:hypothetical protein
VNHTDARGERIESDEAAALKSLLSEASTVAAGSDARPPAPPRRQRSRWWRWRSLHTTPTIPSRSRTPPMAPRR